MPQPSRSDMRMYVSNKKQLIRVICRTHQWSGLSENTILRWINNFKDDEGRYIGTKLFLHSLYYSESDLISLLKLGIYDKIIGNGVRRKQIEDNNIFITKSILVSKIKDELTKTLFVPLLHDNKPSESGLAIIRYLTNNLSIPPSNTAFHFELNAEKINNFNRIIILDDCLGSGQHLKQFWNGTEKKIGFKDIISSQGKNIYFLCLVGYENSKFDLFGSGKIEGLEIVFCDSLTDDHRILSSSHNAWRDEQELLFAKDYLQSLCRSKGIPMFGYKDLDFAVFIHNTAPDWTLPIFWKSVEDEWFNLVNRKNTIL